VTQSEIVSFCGPQSLEKGQSISFLFDLAITPSKPIDMASHYGQRTLQLGYGGQNAFIPAKEVASRGATIMTLHQGLHGLVDGGMINP